MTNQTKNIVALGIVLGILAYLKSKSFLKNNSLTANPNDGDYENAIGVGSKKKSKFAFSAVKTKCATNLERMASLFPNTDQYTAEIGKAYEKQGSNFNTWAQSEAKPCFVVGIESGGLQSGGINMTGAGNF